jgi:hypothetical protein
MTPRTESRAYCRASLHIFLFLSLSLSLSLSVCLSVSLSIYRSPSLSLSVSLFVSLSLSLSVSLSLLNPYHQPFLPSGLNFGRGSMMSRSEDHPIISASPLPGRPFSYLRQKTKVLGPHTFDNVEVRMSVLVLPAMPPFHAPYVFIG